MTARRQDWQIRFAEFAADRAARPFAWGDNDCCLFAADAVLALTGQDPAAAWRGYSTASDAARCIKQMGGLQAIAIQALGPAIAPALATVGDIVLIEHGGRQLLAVCNGATALAPGEHGAVTLDMQAARAAWRI